MARTRLKALRWEQGPDKKKLWRTFCWNVPGIQEPEVFFSFFCGNFSGIFCNLQKIPLIFTLIFAIRKKYRKNLRLSQIFLVYFCANFCSIFCAVQKIPHFFLFFFAFCRIYRKYLRYFLRRANYSAKIYALFPENICRII